MNRHFLSTNLQESAWFQGAADMPVSVVIHDWFWWGLIAAGPVAAKKIQSTDSWIH